MSIEKHPTKTGWYYVKHYPNGRNQPAQRTPVEGYSKAAALDNAIKNAKTGSKQQPSATRPRLETIVDDYLHWVEKNQSPHTLRNKKDRLLRFIIPALGHYRGDELNQVILDQYGQQHTRSMYRVDLVHIMALLTWMIKRNYCPPLTWKPELPTVVSKIKLLPDPEQIIATIEAVPRESARMLFYMQLYTGLRPNEARQLRWENYRGDMIIITETDQDNPQAIPIPAILQPWFTSNQKPAGWCFESTHRRGRPWSNLHWILHTAGQKTGVQLTPHMLRHASAELLLDGTDDIYKVSAHLRHTRVTTTEVYLRRTAKRKRAAVNLIENKLTTQSINSNDKT